VGAFFKENITGFVFSMFEPSILKPFNRLLLLLSVIELTEPQRVFAQHLIGQISDWQGLFQTAARNHSLPLMARHLRSLGYPDAARPFIDEVQAAVAQQAIHNLKTVSELRKFVENCIHPLGMPFVVFKGITLTRRFYPDLGLRPCRDIDIAIESDNLEPLIRKALSEGYVLYAPNGKGGGLSRERDIIALLKYARSAVLISPSGIAIDLQPGIDKFSGIFDRYNVFDNLQSLDFGGLSLPVLPPEFLFNYICHHHARHLWSRLHWLSDLDALLRSPQMNLDRARAMADRLGQRGTIDAAVELHSLVATPAPWDEKMQGHGWEFLRLCLLNLSGDLELERRMALHMIGGEFMFRWQADEYLLQKARRNWIKTMLTPSFHQYQMIPLPAALQWLYYPTRLMQLGVDGMRRKLGHSG